MDEIPAEYCPPGYTKENLRRYWHIYHMFNDKANGVLSAYEFYREFPEVSAYTHWAIEDWFQEIEGIYGVSVNKIKGKGWSIRGNNDDVVSELTERFHTQVLLDFENVEEEFPIKHRIDISPYVFYFPERTIGPLSIEEYVIVEVLGKKESNFKMINFQLSPTRRRCFATFVRNGGYIDEEIWKAEQKEAWFQSELFEEDNAYMLRNSKRGRREEPKVRGRDFRSLMSSTSAIVSDELPNFLIKGITGIGGYSIDGMLLPRLNYLNGWMDELIPRGRYYDLGRRMEDMPKSFWGYLRERSTFVIALHFDDLAPSFPFSIKPQQPYIVLFDRIFAQYDNFDNNLNVKRVVLNGSFKQAELIAAIEHDYVREAVLLKLFDTPKNGHERATYKKAIEGIRRNLKRAGIEFINKGDVYDEETESFRFPILIF